MPLVILVFGLLAQTSDANVRAWPGTCPHACCSYNTEWIATAPAPAFAEPRVSADPGPPAFVVQRGESVRALTGTLFTIESGSLQVNEDVSADASYADFSERHRQMITLNAGDTRELFAIRGETYRISHRDSIVDANLRLVGTRDACARATPACVAVITKPPITKWWVMVMNAQRQAGWLQDPQTFTVPQPCR